MFDNLCKKCGANLFDDIEKYHNSCFICLGNYAIKYHYESKYGAEKWKKALKMSNFKVSNALRLIENPLF